ncbi:PREDICTED: E3 SUMO-protein ligase SIZ1-like isoform X2 [Tarenaya hassleriana]|uniref:E3 SUMO-protein ligase SIZ1-like isoform X2 n=1 Tax=Tarenaya hassleriana TaxID=28532 RepID=UPI00053C2D4B|nr:PREDICTED: E3 SUMO-protein ligase SIZ1-like isoform X2 [Tarenaya hassleriana]
MDLVTTCKDKLESLRVKELKDVLTQLGLSKQGKKQDLVQRILAILSDEQAARLWSKKNAVAKDEVAKVVDDTYRKMQVSGAIDLASKGQVGSDISNVKVKGEVEDPFQSAIKVRCLCGSSLETDSMIQCQDRRCRVWEHVGCIIIPEKPMEGNPLLPNSFYCELCRLTRADPFWVTVAHALIPVKLIATTVPTDGTNPMQGVEKTFQITRAMKDLVAKQEYGVQAWCMLLNDKVQFRMQWPQYADLQVNGLPVRAINRPGSQLLGANGRDDGPIITHCIRDGVNKISLNGCDARVFCFGVRLVKRRTLQQVLNMIPAEAKDEPFDEALARVRRCVGGGTGDDNADSDSDIEVVADYFTVNLRCPMSGSRIKVAGRFKPCAHMGCFDLEVFVELNQRSRKWQCPICLKNYSLEHIIMDPYFNRVTSKMRHCDEDVTEIEVKPDGSWRVKSKREMGELTQWHLPDGNFCPSPDEVKSNVETFTGVKQKGCSDGLTGLKLGIRKNHNGVWEVSKPSTNGFSSGSREEKVQYQEHNIKPMSSSATGSGRDGDDPSINQEGVRPFDFANNQIELDSMSRNVDSGYDFTDRNQPAAARNSEVIVLSDSDDENVLIASEAAHKCNQTVSRLPPEIQGGPGFQIFAPDTDISGGMVPVMNGGFTVAPDKSMASVPMVPDSVVRSEPNTNNGLVDNNPLAFSRDDPSLQIFLPTRSDALGQSNFRNQVDMSNSIRRDDWISLRLGDNGCGNHGGAAPANGFNPNQPMSGRKDTSDNLTETGSLLLGMNESRPEKVSRQRSKSQFSFPRQKRSVRPRLFLSNNSDSE